MTGRVWEDCCRTVMNEEEQIRGSPTGSLWKLLQSISVGFRQGQEATTDHLNSGSVRSTTLSEAFRDAATRGTAEQSDHPSHMDRQQE